MHDAGASESHAATEAHARPTYNPVFEKLVTDSDDLVGLVAYALYKDHKRRWLFRLRETLREPTESDEQAFLASVQADLESYRDRANDAIVAYA